MLDTPFVDYLLPNFKKLSNPLVRQALAVADLDAVRRRRIQGRRPAPSER